MLSGIVKLVKIGFEYKEAVDAAVEKSGTDASLVEVVRTFADATGTKIDDQVVDAIVKFIEELKVKLPELDKSKDDLLFSFKTYWPPFKVQANAILDNAENSIPAIISALRSSLLVLEERVEDLEGLFAMADIAIQLLEEQLEDITESEPDAVS